MTERLYMEDCYLRSFQATVETVDDDFIVLDSSAFYPEGGGQPPDRGSIETDENTIDVLNVQKEHGEIRHYIETTAPLEEGMTVEGTVDWERRYRLMRMHTAQHLLSAVVLKMFDAETAGNQIHPDHSRMDFAPVSFSEEDLQRIENQCNSLIQEERDVRITEMPRERVEEMMNAGRSNIDLIPDHIDPLRVVEIDGLDLCPCGGTHISSLDEIGGIEIQERQSKGSDTDRVRFTIDDA